MRIHANTKDALAAGDDYLNAKTGDGISVRQKFLWQLVVAVGAALYIQNHFDITAQPPVVLQHGQLPWLSSSRRHPDRRTSGTTTR